MITSPPVWWLGSSFQLWSAGAAALFSLSIVNYLVSFVNENKRISLYFQGFPGFAGLRVFRPDLIPGGGGIWRRQRGGGLSPKCPTHVKRAFFKNSAKIKKDIPVPFSNIYDTIGNLPLS